jgi:hypothetical protein
VESDENTDSADEENFEADDEVDIDPNINRRWSYNPFIGRSWVHPANSFHNSSQWVPADYPQSLKLLESSRKNYVMCAKMKIIVGTCMLYQLMRVTLGGQENTRTNIFIGPQQLESIMLSLLQRLLLI